MRQWLGGGKPERVGSLGGHHPRGRASLGSCPAGKCWIDVLPGGDELARAGVVEIDVMPAAVQAVTVRLERPVCRIVQVRDAAGEPVSEAGVDVRVVAAGIEASAGLMLELERARPRWAASLPWRLPASKTDASGKVELVLPVSLRQYEISVRKLTSCRRR